MLTNMAKTPLMGCAAIKSKATRAARRSQQATALPGRTSRQSSTEGTSVVIGLGRLPEDELPAGMTISAVTLAELAAGPHATDDASERARRQERLQLAEAVFDPLQFDAACARAYGRVYAETLVAGRKARGRRAVDLLTGPAALAADLPLYAANPDDFIGLDEVITVRAVASPGS
jgi:predicted nucleic acid-binding protein